MSTALPRRVAVALATLAVGAAQAQPAEPAAFAVTYLEVAPAAAEEALGLLRAHAAATRAEPGCAGIVVLRRVDRPHHFAMVEQWRDAAAAEAHRATPRMAEWRGRLAPALIAPYDERPHGVLSVGAAAEAPGAIYAVTHVDVIPPQKDAGTALVTAFAQAIRGTPGNLRFDSLVQNSRANHFTLVEAWADEAALLAHAAAPRTREMRRALGPMSGSLFDERLYRAVAWRNPHAARTV